MENIHINILPISNKQNQIVDTPQENNDILSRLNAIKSGDWQKQQLQILRNGKKNEIKSANFVEQTKKRAFDTRKSKESFSDKESSTEPKKTKISEFELKKATPNPTKNQKSGKNYSNNNSNSKKGKSGISTNDDCGNLKNSQSNQIKAENNINNKTFSSESPIPVEFSTILSSSNDFSDLNLDERILEYLKLKLNFKKPTAIQAHAIPLLLNSHDALIKAQTGSGKTLAYVLPILQDLITNGQYEKKHSSDWKLIPIDRSSGTYAIIIAPTHELVLQIYNVVQSVFRPFHTIVPGLIMGGEKRSSEKARLRKGISVLIATPGRLLDHLQNTESFCCEKCRWLVFDEADRLLDMGFEKDLNQIIKILDSKKQLDNRKNVLASATLNKDVNRLALVSLKNPYFVSYENQRAQVKPLSMVQEEDIPHDERVYDIPKTLKQHYLIYNDKRKLLILISFLRSLLTSIRAKIIVFFSNCDSVDFYYMLLSKIEIPLSLKKNADRESIIPGNIFKLHGQLSQLVRCDTFKSFSECERGVLLCTDVASRGLDIPAVNWIVQYDVPTDPAAYIHRIGRTARMGHTGDALLFLADSERSYLEILAKRKMKIGQLSEESIIKHLKVNLERNPKNDCLQECASLQLLIDNYVNKGEMKNLAIKAFQSFIRSYATHTKLTKHIFHIRNLHLGHLCRNFCLRDNPSELNSILRSRVSSSSNNNNNNNNDRKKPQISSNNENKRNNKSNSLKSFSSMCNEEFAIKNEFENGFGDNQVLPIYAWKDKSFLEITEIIEKLYPSKRIRSFDFYCLEKAPTHPKYTVRHLFTFLDPKDGDKTLDSVNFIVGDALLVFVQF